MHAYDRLPDHALRRDGAVTAEFRARGIADLRAAARHVMRLPYGRISDREGFRRLVLAEGRGTCTTKHALIAELAREQRLDIPLVLGLYEMTERNTPGVGRVLSAHGLSSILEAHCYLTYRGARVDVTRAASGADDADAFVHEETITPDQIGSYKIALHRRFLAEWIPRSGAAGRTLDDVWRIREACIAALGGA